jgi:hypothetical protein
MEVVSLPGECLRLTDLTLSCAARALAPKPLRQAGCAYTAGQRCAICNLHDAAALGFGLGGSAAAPKPGRDSSSGKFGGDYLMPATCRIIRYVTGPKIPSTCRRLNRR